MLRCAFARRLSVQMLFRYAQVSYRSALVDPNASPMCSNALSLDACRSKCISDVLKCAFARRLSIQMHFRYAQMRFRSTFVNPNAFPGALGFARGDSDTAQCNLAERSEASPRETRPAAEGGRPHHLAERSEALPRASRGFQTKARMCFHCMRLSM